MFEIGGDRQGSNREMQDELTPGSLRTYVLELAMRLSTWIVIPRRRRCETDQQEEAPRTEHAADGSSSNGKHLVVAT